MKILKLEKLSNGRYKILLDNNEKFITYDDIIIKNNLLYKSDISDELINKIKESNNYYSVYNKVLNYIAKKIRSKKEILTYLKKFELKDEEIDNIIKSLLNNNLLNDEKFVRAYIMDHIYLNNDGLLKIRKDLLNHDIDELIIDKEISKIDDEIYIKKLEHQILKKIKINTKYSRNLLKQKLIMEFNNKGYEKDMIISVFDNYYKENNDILKKEYNKIYNKLSKKYSGDILNYKVKEKLYQKGFDIANIDLL